MPTIFFDYDGTLHDTMLVYAPAFREAHKLMVESGRVGKEDFSEEMIRCTLGMNASELWDKYMPSATEEERKQGTKYIEDKIINTMKDGGRFLFEGIPEALTTLKQQGYTMVFLSNCDKRYRDFQFEIYHLDTWLSSAFCAEDFSDIPKWQIYQKIAARFPKDHVMVGDRGMDIAVGTYNNIASVGCTWGYAPEGELDAATVLCASPQDLPHAINKALLLTAQAGHSADN